jgi:ribosomal-protein-alanine N-acetyltransferase
MNYQTESTVEPLRKHHIRLKRVLLRVIDESDAAELFRVYSNPLVSKYLPDPPQTLEEAHELARELCKSWTTYGYGMWAVLDLTDLSFIGRCGFFYRPTNNAETPTHELAYLLDDSAWGRGIATECARACLRYGFEVKQFDSVYAITRNENVRSRRVMQNLNMIYRPREPFISQGKVFYSLLRDEYVPTRDPFTLLEV